jgi:ATP-binding cassette subfamily F protein 3
MLMMPSNFLLLDEPTNHLDLRAKDVLLTALQEFTGTVVFVSHDRYFIDKLATRVFEVADGRVTDYPGNYEDYLWKKAQPGIAEEPAEAEEVAAPVSAVATNIDGAGAQKRLNPIKLRQMQQRQGEIEQEVARLESEITQIELSLANYRSAEETVRQTELLGARRDELQSLMREWEEVAQCIEAQ